MGKKLVLSAIIMVIATCSENAEEGILLYTEIQSVFHEGWKA